LDRGWLRGRALLYFWQKDWGVDLQPFGSGENIIKYLGRYVCRTAISDARITSVTDTHVSFRWKDRANGNAQKIDTIPGAEFIARYLRHVLRHVLPRGLRAVRYYRFCHPAAKLKREHIAFHTGRPLLIGAAAIVIKKPAHVVTCSCCGQPKKKLLRLLPPLAIRSTTTSKQTQLRMKRVRANNPKQHSFFPSSGQSNGELRTRIEKPAVKESFTSQIGNISKKHGSD
jgi:hypothetical protein